MENPHPLLPRILIPKSIFLIVIVVYFKSYIKRNQRVMFLDEMCMERLLNKNYISFMLENKEIVIKPNA